MKSIKIFTLIGIILTLPSCFKKSKSTNANLIFSGACQVNLDVQNKAHISLDGIVIGHKSGKYSVDVPCGEKNILAEKDGYLPFAKTITTMANNPINIKIKLTKKPKSPNKPYALSSKLINDITKNPDKFVPKTELASNSSADASEIEELETDFDIWDTNDWL